MSAGGFKDHFSGIADAYAADSHSVRAGLVEARLELAEGG